MNVVKIQQVAGIARKAGVKIGRKLSSHTGWVFEAVDNDNRHALTINGRVHTPAEAVRVHFNVSHWPSLYNDQRVEEAPVLIAALTAKGWTVESTGRSEFIVKAGA